ncbi:MAG: precorrin-6y C5,15-methyltransferase (decarboxylating) subunit CbiE [Kineosporiaceae bacterium]
MSVHVVGCDGAPLRPEAAAALGRAGLVVGARRHLDAVAVPAGARVVVMGEVTAALDALARHDGDAVVLASGDPGFFGIVRRLRDRGLPVVVHPGVSSVALAAARAGLPWDDLTVVSAHGRDPRAALAVVRSGVACVVLTDAVTGPAQVAAAAPPTARVVVCERLGGDGERVVDLPAAQVPATGWHEPNVVVVDPRPAPPAPAAPVRIAGRPQSSGRAADWALPEDAFEHRDGMVTKAEVRAWALARLGPRPGRVVWDVGAGSGSVAVECARLGAAVVAIERDPHQCARIRANAAAHAVHVDVVEGAAPAALAALPPADAVFVGGGGLDVLAAVAACRPAVVVVALAALDRVAPAVQLLRAAAFAVDGVQLAASRLADLPGGSLRLAALNPVTVLTGTAPDVQELP